MKILAIIPARFGSKGVPRKNIIPVCGKPLIQYSIEAALESKLLTNIIVSSDSQEILDVASGFPAVKIHKRNKKLATDTSPVIYTIKAILQELNDTFDAVMILQPTSPIRTGIQIDNAIELLDKHKEANSLVSVVAMNDIHPARMYWMKNDLLESILPQFENLRRQDIPFSYYRNGSIYLTRTNVLIEHELVLIPPTVGFEMPLNQLLNIDEPRDILIAETLIKAWKEKKI